jgi:glutathione S-transferase
MILYKSSIDPGNGVHWYVKELGLGEEIKVVEYAFDDKDHEKPEYLRVNPFGT